jgi:hypothetical protein
MKKEDFNFSSSIKAVDSISKSLDTFNNVVELLSLDEQIERFTKKNQSITMSIDPDKVRNIDKSELSWRKLNLVNPNNILRIKGMLLKMQMDLYQIQYENAGLRKKAPSEKEIEALKKDYHRARMDFDKFIKEHFWQE